MRLIQTSAAQLYAFSSVLMWSFCYVRGEKSLKKSFSDAIQRDCHPHLIKIYVNKSALFDHETPKNGQLTLGEDTAHCSANHVSNSSHFVIVSLYDECRSHKRTIPGKLIWSNQVKLWGPEKRLDGTRELLAAKDIQCAIPTTDPSVTVQNQMRLIPEQLISTTTQDPEANVTFHLQIFSNFFTGDAWMSFPHNADLNRMLFLQTSIRFTHTENEDLDLRALALDCFFSKNSNSYDTSSKYYLLKNGCAVDSAVTLYQSPEWKRASRLSFKFNRFYYEPTSHLFLHCRIGACSNRGQREAEGFPQCPSSTLCSAEQPNGITEESDFRYLKFVRTGPIRVVVDRTTVNREATTTCPPCSIAEMESSTMASARQQPRPNVVEGLNIPTVIGISIAAFVVGLALMGGLWYIHENTSPKNFKLGSQTTSHDSGSTDSTSLHQMAPLLVSTKVPPSMTLSSSEKLMSLRLSRDTEVV